MDEELKPVELTCKNCEKVIYSATEDTHSPEALNEAHREHFGEQPPLKFLCVKR